MITWTAFLAAAIKSLPLLLQIVNGLRTTADGYVQRGLGRDQAVAAALKEVAERAAIAREIENDGAPIDPDVFRKD